LCGPIWNESSQEDILRGHDHDGRSFPDPFLGIISWVLELMLLADNKASFLLTTREVDWTRRGDSFHFKLITRRKRPKVIQRILCGNLLTGHINYNSCHVLCFIPSCLRSLLKEDGLKLMLGSAIFNFQAVLARIPRRRHSLVSQTSLAILNHTLMSQ